MELRYITNGMSSPEGKPRVYFSCHPDDFDLAFPLIPEDILRHVNCAVWYDTDPAAAPDRRELEEVLDEMQLVVFAVTSRFLYEENRARNIELPLALEKHMPILPIMLENGLGYKFSNICAKIQVVSKYAADPTATPYEEVLATFLHAVLIGDELAEKVRNAFDAYVFLSYRKKDRRHARRLMRLIHENEAYENIAIWFDEFLVPGEGFNEAIADAFEKSSLFAMAVTPHLEEDGNYVMRVEYPMARDRVKKDSKFAIVPVEMYEPEDGEEGKDWRINTKKLRRHGEFRYRKICRLRNEHRRPQLDSVFLRALNRIAKKENDGSPQHRFFIGLAYLNGIDVETNYEKALKLIRAAAEAEDPCMEATEKLADMYLHGDGVPYDLQKAMQWQETLAAQYLRAYTKDHDPDAHKGFGTLYFKSLLKLSDIQREAGKIPDAVETARQALTFTDRLLEEVGIREQERDRALLLNRLGSLYRKQKEYAAAEDCFIKSCRIYERQAREIGTRRVRRDLSVSYEHLGDLRREQKDPAGAESYYSKAEKIRKELEKEASSPGTRRDLSLILTKLGNIYKDRKNPDLAQKYYGEALEMDRVLAAELRTPQSRDDYGVSLSKTGDIYKMLGNLPEASARYGQALDLFTKNKKTTASPFFLDHYAGGCEKLASVKKKLGETEEAARLYLAGIEAREQLYDASDTLSAAHQLAVSCYNAALFLVDSDLMQRARELWDTLSQQHPEYLKYRDRAHF